MQILDSKTDKPLQDISVYQIIESDVYGGCIKIFPLMDPTDKRYVFEAKKTDENGSVAFPKKQLKLACSEYVTKEYLVINVDLKPGAYESDLAQLSITRVNALIMFAITPLEEYQEEYATTLNKDYRGYVIYGAEYPLGQGYWQGRQKLYDVQTNGQGLLAPEQNFTVRLEPAK